MQSDVSTVRLWCDELLGDLTVEGDDTPSAAACTHVASAHPDGDALVARAAAALRDVNITVDTDLSAVDYYGGATRVALSCVLSPADTDDAIVRSVVHLVVEQELGPRHAPLSVIVHLLRPVSPSAATSIQKWIHEQRAGVEEWAAQCARLLAHAMTQRLIDAYPWRAKEQMREAARTLCSKSLIHVHGGAPDPVLGQGNVDHLLPPLPLLLDVASVGKVAQRLHLYLGRPPSSRVEAYETIYLLATTGRACQATQHAYSLLFE
jgi:hypothetical protein